MSRYHLTPAQKEAIERAHIEKLRAGGWHEKPKRGISCLIVFAVFFGLLSFMPMLMLRISCTEPVSALMLSDRQKVEGVEKYVQKYVYDYNGEHYDVRFRSRFMEKSIESGTRTEIYVDPENPTICYNRKTCDGGLLLSGVLLTAMIAYCAAVWLTPDFRGGKRTLTDEETDGMDNPDYDTAETLEERLTKKIRRD